MMFDKYTKDEMEAMESLLPHVNNFDKGLDKNEALADEYSHAESTDSEQLPASNNHLLPDYNLEDESLW